LQSDASLPAPTKPIEQERSDRQSAKYSGQRDDPSFSVSFGPACPVQKKEAQANKQDGPNP